MDKVVLVYKALSPRISFIKDVLKDNYIVLDATSYDITKDFVVNLFDDIALLLIDNPSGNEYTNELLKYVASKNSFMFTLPIMVLTDAEMMKYDDAYLNDPVVGIISTSDTKNVILTRIAKSLKYVNSTSFEEFSNMLKVLPSIIYLKDKKGRYAFCSQHWHHTIVDHKMIRGKTDYDIRRDKKNAQIAREADMEILKTGVGKNYIIKEEDDIDGLDYLQIIKEPLKNEKGETYGIIAIINNVTEEELMRQQLREKSITDQLTGLYNRFYFEELAKEREGHFQYPLTIITADCDNLKIINDQFGHQAGDQYICYARDVLKECSPDDAYIFRMGGDEFLVAIPNTPKGEGKDIVKRIMEQSEKYKNDRFSLKISVGSYTIENASTTIEVAVNQSDREMYKIKKQHKQEENN